MSEWDGMTDRGIDCSGLVHMAYRRLGRLVPRDAHEQEAAAEELREQDLRPGDLVFFGPRERADHIAFWLGEGRILHATGRDGVHAVVEEPLENVSLEHELRFGASNQALSRTSPLCEDWRSQDRGFIHGEVQ